MIESASTEVCDNCGEYRRCAKLVPRVGSDAKPIKLCGPCLGKALESITGIDGGDAVNEALAEFPFEKRIVPITSASDTD